MVIDVEARECRDKDGPSASAHPQPAAMRGGRFVAGSYTNAAGSREYKLFIPPGADVRPLPLVVMLHGCTQDPDDFAAGTGMNDAALAQGFFVLYPAQPARANPQRCWNWFKHTHQQRNRGEPALLAELTRDIIARHSIDAQRVYVAGLSAGGAMAAILGNTYPDLYAAVGVHSGLAPGSATDLPSALSAMKSGRGCGQRAASGMPTIVFHGDADTTVHPGNAEQIVAAAAGPTAAVECQQVQGSHDRRCTRHLHRAADGSVIAERWVVHGAPHAWSGGSSKGSYTDGRGPNATREMLRFFFERKHCGVI
ncbi:PHB depolymerase family esterase [Aquabacterium sp. A7-Y]|uniref:extracellular catalytic domain type 1 short-chain-length polyhydroxyalkanoate depolymerase n=1 Tax=Aquabacterium sp. A7-Y TaxID=1349605 RepID=UPI002AC85D43|nr:PHB depolymerase family esterase [Aquabacterium sp. A7-Y]